MGGAPFLNRLPPTCSYQQTGLGASKHRIHSVHQQQLIGVLARDCTNKLKTEMGTTYKKGGLCIDMGYGYLYYQQHNPKMLVAL